MANKKLNGRYRLVNQMCRECDSEDIRTSYEAEELHYGSGDEAVKLPCLVPVKRCQACGLAFTDDEAEDIRHETVCRYLKVLTPREILEIRKRYGFSRNEFSKLTRIGEASLARWENGLLIQNSANDHLLYLLRYQENVERLKRREYASIAGKTIERKEDRSRPCYSPSTIQEKVFRALTLADKETLRTEAKLFCLRREAA